MIPKTFIEKLYNTVKIEEYIERAVPLKHKVNICSGECPFCGNKSFYVYPQTRSFYCFSCGAGGDLITYIKKKDKKGYVEAVRTLADYAGIAMPSDHGVEKNNEKQRAIMRECARFYHHQLRVNPNAKYAIQILHTWGLYGRTIVSLGIGFHDDSFQALVNYAKEQKLSLPVLKEQRCVLTTNGRDYDAMRNSIIVPTVDPVEGVVAFEGFLLDKQQWIHYPKTESFDRKKYLYGLNLAIKTKKSTVVVVSSYLDYFRLVGMGITNVVFTYLPELSEEQADLLQKYFRIVLLWFPAYVPKSTYRAKCKKRKLMCEDLPLSDCETPTEYLLKYGAKVVEAKINEFEGYLAE